MNDFTLLLAAPAAGGPPAFMNLLLLLAMGLIFWFLVFRPQMKRQKEHRAKVAGLKKNDRVVTGGGLVGKVVKLDEQFVELELAPGVRVQAVRQTIGDVLPARGTSPAND